MIGHKKDYIYMIELNVGGHVNNGNNYTFTSGRDHSNPLNIDSKNSTRACFYIK